MTCCAKKRDKQKKKPAQSPAAPRRSASQTPKSSSKSAVGKREQRIPINNSGPKVSMVQRAAQRKSLAAAKSRKSSKSNKSNKSATSKSSKSSAKTPTKATSRASSKASSRASSTAPSKVTLKSSKSASSVTPVSASPAPPKKPSSKEKLKTKTRSSREKAVAETQASVSEATPPNEASKRNRADPLAPPNKSSGSAADNDSSQKGFTQQTNVETLTVSPTKDSSRKLRQSKTHSKTASDFKSQSETTVSLADAGIRSARETGNASGDPIQPQQQLVISSFVIGDRIVKRWTYTDSYAVGTAPPSLGRFVREGINGPPLRSNDCPLNLCPQKASAAAEAKRCPKAEEKKAKAEEKKAEDEANSKPRKSTKPSVRRGADDTCLSEITIQSSHSESESRAPKKAKNLKKLSAENVSRMISESSEKVCAVATKMRDVMKREKDDDAYVGELTKIEELKAQLDLLARAVLQKRNADAKGK